MPENPVMKNPVVMRVIPWWWCCGFILFPCILWWWCCRTCWPWPPVADPVPQLVIEHDGAAAWMAVDNNFWEPPDDGVVYYWPGVLFQLGSFHTAQYVFDLVELRSDGSIVKKYGPGEEPFTWINIVSDYPMTSGTHTDDPLDDPDRAFYLYPNSHATNCCDSLVVSVLSSATSCADMDVEDCLRNRLLMWSTSELAGIMTYWQGPEGYRVEASQEGWPEGDNRYEFFFEDDFRIEVYEEQSGSMVLIAEHSSTSATDPIDEIIVRARAKGPTGGSKQAPPWPDGEYP